MIIAIDMDEVLADFISKLINFHNEVYKTSLTRDMIFTYEFNKVWGGTLHEAIQKVIQFQGTKYFDEIKPVNGAVDRVKKLKKNNELLIIT